MAWDPGGSDGGFGGLRADDRIRAKTRRRLDRDAQLCRRQVRHDISVRGHDPAYEGRGIPDAGAICDLSPEMRIVWEIDRKLQQDVVRPMLYCQRSATCRRPEVKGLTIMVNSIFNGWRMEDVWLDR